MGITSLDRAVHGYFEHSLAPSTLSLYRSASTRYRNFCTHFNLPFLPLTQDTLTRFVSYLAQSGLTYQSIRTYLSGIRFLQIASGLPDPHINTFPVLNYVLRGIHRLPSAASQRPARRPITLEILNLLYTAWSTTHSISQYNAAMLWAACCTGFFGFMRAGEFTCQSLQAFTPQMLGPQDISVDSHQNPSTITILLRHSKTDPFGNGVNIYLGRTSQTICPVAALLGYLAQRGQRPGPLFLFQDGSPLSKDRLLSHIRQVLSTFGVDTTGLTGHSFRIGAASAAADSGMEDSLVQTLGRWHSHAFLRYLRTPAHRLAASSAQLLVHRMCTQAPQTPILPRSPA